MAETVEILVEPSLALIRLELVLLDHSLKFSYLASEGDDLFIAVLEVEGHSFQLSLVLHQFALELEQLSFVFGCELQLAVELLIISFESGDVELIVLDLVGVFHISTVH